MQPNHTQELARLQRSHHSPAPKILLQREPGMGQKRLLHSSAHPTPHLESLPFLSGMQEQQGKKKISLLEVQVLSVCCRCNCSKTAAQGPHLVSAGSWATAPAGNGMPGGALTLTGRREKAWFIFEVGIFSLPYRNEPRLIMNHPSLVRCPLELEH